jgi:recombination protein RecR
MEYPLLFQNLIDSFKRLPGVGSKTAERMAYDVLAMSAENIEAFANAISQINNISRCPLCGNLSENDNECEICSCEERDHQTICVVHGPKDVFAFEKMKEYHGVYHVLNGYISPSKGKGYDDINLESLINRIENDNVSEVILATDLTMEGEITAMYISKLLNKYSNLKVTRLAHGLPMGAQLDYADEMTLFKAFSNRKQVG